MLSEPTTTSSNQNQQPRQSHQSQQPQQPQPQQPSIDLDKEVPNYIEKAGIYASTQSDQIQDTFKKFKDSTASFIATQWNNLKENVRVITEDKNDVPSSISGENSESFVPTQKTAPTLLQTGGATGGAKKNTRKTRTKRDRISKKITKKITTKTIKKTIKNTAKRAKLSGSYRRKSKSKR